MAERVPCVKYRCLVAMVVLLLTLARAGEISHIPSNCHFQASAAELPCVTYMTSEMGVIPVNITAMEVYMTGMDTAQLQQGSLGKLGHLHTLYITLNNVTNLPSGLFNKLVTLRTLHITSVMAMIHCSYLILVYPGLGANLTRLGLRSLGLTHIPPLVFSELSQLRAISLENNHLNSISPVTFVSNGNLAWLDLSGNSFAALADLSLSSALSNLITVNISGNCIEERGGNDLTQTTLVHLIVAHNCVTKLSPGAFHRLTKLHRLDLHDNMLESLDRAAFRGAHNPHNP